MTDERHTETRIDALAPAREDIGTRVEFLSRVGLFQLLSPLTLREVATVLEAVSVPAGGVVVAAGDPGDALFLVREGTLVVQSGVDGAPLARLGPGEFFGEIALLTGGPRTATVRAEGPVQLWRVGAGTFRRLLEDTVVAAAAEQTMQLRQRSQAAQEYQVEHCDLATLLQDRLRVSIGRAEDNDVVLPSRVVSAHHAVVQQRGDRYVITDLGSSNGTFVNGAPVRSATLKPGDEIWIADQRMTLAQRDLTHVQEPSGVRIDAVGLRHRLKSGKDLLQDVTLTILPGELVAIVGTSGAGKTTLMDALSGVRPPTSGQVLYNGLDFSRERARYRSAMGYVPQDDIIHTELPLRVTLELAARLRLPGDTSKADRRAAVDQALANLGLVEQRDVVVDRLSGGQRKRASIGVELLTQPRVFFLDEPTSGLDPATDTDMMLLLRGLARQGSTVVLTTHATKNVALCDKVVVMAPGGYLAFVGTPDRALEHFGVDAVDEIYRKLDTEGTHAEWAERFRASPDQQRIVAGQHRPVASPQPAPAARSGGIRQSLRQFRVLSRRTTELYLRDRARLIPLLAQPVLFSVLLLVIFEPGLFEPDTPDPTGAIQLVFLVAFTIFIFGLLYGVQEVVKEFPIFRRERLVNLGVTPYLLSKLTFLLPVMLLVTGVIVGVLWATDRLPDAGAGVYVPLMVTLVLTAMAGLAVALFTSAVARTSQGATDLLTVWIMPQVLFAGALFPIASMAAIGQAISTLAVVRWSFEAAGRSVELNPFLAQSFSPIGDRLLLQYADAFARDVWENWVILGAWIVVPLVLAGLILRRRTRT